MAESGKKPAAKAKKAKNEPEKNDKKDFLVVGLGASAGGVRALQDFFAAMPPNSGMAFVVIVHLSPHHESNLDHVLQAKTAMPVIQVNETHKVEPNHVYVIPPNQHLEMVDGIIRLAKKENEPGIRAAIDVFFRTLAEAYERNAVCIVLTGTGSDGTLGLKRVKESNGFAVVQDPHDAEYDQMPRNAIATGLADWVLPIAQMPEKLLSFKASSERLHLTDSDADKVAKEIHAEESLREILTVLRVRTGHDFSNYKTPTLVRRIARHLQIHELEDIPSYLSLLRDDPEEVVSLQRNLLINVTNFFRDKEAFAALEREVIPNLFADKNSRDTVRVWSAACASGEEAYSVAMLLSEHASRLNDPPKFQVFATDVDDEAIAEGREHSYAESIEADVSPERLKRFFNKEGNRYRVKKELRETVLFAPHNVLRDPPFSKLDLVICRNLLIYLNRETQERVMEIFHFALLLGGYLFLGNSETAENIPNLFSIVDKKHRIYSRRAVHPNQQFAAPQMPNLGKWQVKIPDRQEIRERNKGFSLGEVHYKLLEKFAPPSALVNQDFDVLYMSETVGRYMRFSGGEPTNNILKLVHPDLLPDLRAALFMAQQEHQTSEFPNIRLTIDDEETTINLIVRAVRTEEDDRELLLVIFDEAGKSQQFLAADSEKRSQTAQVFNKDEAMEVVVSRLEKDLQRTRQHLRSTIEQHEVSIEELKASNEELQAINEELRSASEELETSKEELQSVNEELTTVNHELKDKIDETIRANSDMHNLMSATDIATIFLDKHLQIKRYTPPVEDFFNITKADIGRPLEHFTHKLNYDDLAKDAAQVLKKLAPIEREINSREERAFLARFVPYRTLDDRIDGIVLNFIDISERKKAEIALSLAEAQHRAHLEQEVRARTAELEASKNLVQATMDATLNMIQVFEAVRNDAGAIIDFKYILLNKYAEQWMPDALGKSLLHQQPGVVKEGIFDAFKEVTETGVPQQYEKHYVHEQFDGWFHQSVVKLNDGVVTTTAAITDRKKAEQELRQSKRLLQDIINAPNIGIAVYDAVRNEKGEIIDFVHDFINRASVQMLGEDYIGKLFTDHGENAALQMRQFIEAIETGQGNAYIREADFRGNKVWFSITNTPLDGNRLVHTWEDVTERKHTEAELLRLKDEIARKATDKYETLFNSIDEAFALIEVICDESGKPVDLLWLETNAVFEQYIGFIGTGKKMSEVIGEVEPFWYDLYDRVLRTGEPQRVEYTVEKLDKWYRAYLSRIGGAGSRQVALVFDDITERKRREEVQTFLLQLTDSLRSLTDPNEIRSTAMQLMGSHLVVNRAAYVDAEREPDTMSVISDYTRDVQPWVGKISLSDFGAALGKDYAEGKTVAIADVQNDERFADSRDTYAALEIGAAVGVPLLKNGLVVAAMGVHNKTPRHWTPDEINIIEEVAEHTWAAVERARAEEALHQSQSRLQLIANLVPDLLWDSEPDGSTTWYNQRWLEYTGQSFEGATGWGWINVIHPDDREDSARRYREAVENGVLFRQEHRIRRYDGEYLWFVVRVYPLKDESGRVIKVYGAATDIHELQLMNEALRESEELFRLVSDAVPSVIYDWNVPEDKITRSGELQNLLGFSPDDPQTQTNNWWKTRLHPEDAKRAAGKVVEKLKSNEYRFENEYRLQHRDGHYVWVWDTGVLLRDKVGKVVRWVGSVSNITLRKEAEEHLRESEARLRITVEAAKMGTWDWDLKTDTVRWNEWHFTLFGMKPTNELITSAAFYDHVHPDDRERVGKALNRTIKTGEPFEAEFCIIREDGKSRWMEGFGQIVERAKGKAVRMSGVMSDVTDRKIIQEAVRKSEERLQLILKSITDYAVITIDPEGIINGWNTGAENTFGYTAKEAVGSPCAIIFTPEDRQAGIPEREMKNALKDGIADDQRWHVRKDGSRFFAAGTISPITNGEFEGFVKVASDQTARMEAEKVAQEKEVLRRLVAGQEDERRRIARDIHDHFGQQITGLRLKLDNARKSNDNRKINAEIEEAQSIAAHLDADVDFIAWELRPAALDDLGLRVTLSNFVREWSHHTKIKAEFHTSGLGKKNFTFEIETNLYRIAQEALNNIYKHAAASLVDVILERRKNEIVLIIEDNGSGFNTKNKNLQDKGLGLNGMRERAAILGGTLSVESKKGTGTTVFARVPVKFES